MRKLSSQCKRGETADDVMMMTVELAQHCVIVLLAGEDGTDLSCAGQMETILGVKGLQQVISN